jgi:hypothetical protein
MIQQRADALVALIERRRTVGQNVDQLQAFRTQRQEVEDACQRLEMVMTTWRLFRARQIGTVSRPPGVALLLEHLTQLQERYNENPSSIVGPNRLGPVKSGVATLVSSLEQQLLSAWAAYVREHTPSASPEVLNVLSRIPTLRTQVDRVWVGLRGLNDVLQRLPTTGGDIDAFDRKAKELLTTWTAFDSTHLPPEVLRFLKEVGSGGAALESLTPTVRQWLDHHHLTASFHIRSVSSTATNS